VNGIPHTVRLGSGDGRRSRVERVLSSDAEGIVGTLLVTTGPGGSAAADLLDTWFRREARLVIGERVAAFARDMGVAPRSVAIRAQRTRWGSASRNGSLSFNWRLLLAPRFVLDAVVVHELAHLVIPGHSARFWALVRRHAPRTDEARRWLRTHHRDLSAALE
jgi:predicted metal-dependent hydrolase